MCMICDELEPLAVSLIHAAARANVARMIEEGHPPEVAALVGLKILEAVKGAPFTEAGRRQAIEVYTVYAGKVGEAIRKGTN